MSEIQNNELFERDAQTNALVPVVASAVEAGETKEVRNGRLYKRDPATNALIPVVEMQGGGGSSGTVEISPLDRTLTMDDDGLRAQIGIRKESGGNLTTQTGLNGVDLMTASREDLLKVTGMKFSGRVTGGAGGESNLAVLFCDPGDDYYYTEQNLLYFPWGGNIDATFAGIELINTLSNAFTYMPSLQEFKIRLAVVSVASGFDGSAQVENGTLTIENDERLVITGKYGTPLASIKIDRPPVRAPIMASTHFQSFSRNAHPPASNAFFPANGTIAHNNSIAGAWVDITKFCYLRIERISPGPVGGLSEQIELVRNGVSINLATNQNMMGDMAWSDVGGWTHLLRPGDKIRCCVYNYGAPLATYTKADAWTTVLLYNIDFVEIPTQ